MRKILCVAAVVCFSIVVSVSAKNNKQIIKLTGEVAENVLTVPVEARYPTVCSYYGVLKFAEATGNQKIIDAVKANYDACPVTSQDVLYTNDKTTGADKRKLPRTNRIRAGHVDWNVFGILPFELYLQTKDEKYLKVAMELAEDEWAKPNTQGLTAYTRFWSDDMFMVGALQVQAYRASGKEVFLERGLTQLLAYAKVLQQDNGLFQHTAEVPIFWGRGNGWAAAVMAMMLENLPENNPKRQELMEHYKKMMAALKKYQAASGLWHQIIIDTESYEETSCTGMFTYAIATGVKNGWLDKSYRDTAMKGWNRITKKVKDGQLEDICVGTSAENNYNHYLNRPRKTGDLHGQAAFLWAGTAMLEIKK